MTLREIKTKFFEFMENHAITKADLCVKTIREQRGLMLGPGHSYFVSRIDVTAPQDNGIDGNLFFNCLHYSNIIFIPLMT